MDQSEISKIQMDQSEISIIQMDQSENATQRQSLLTHPHFTPTHYVTALRKHEMTHLHAMIRTHGMKVHSIRPLPPARSQNFHMTHLHAIIRTHQLPTLTLLPPIRKIRNLYSATN